MARYTAHGGRMIEHARIFATAAHTAIGQVRKYTGEPYITHPAAVVDIVQTLPMHIWEQVAVAWLHDVVEDTCITGRDIEEHFGEAVAMGAMHLTNVSKEAGNRAQRSKLNLEKLALAPDWVKTVKVADLYHNTNSIVKYDPGFARQYLLEKTESLTVLKGADRVLWQLTWEQLQRAKAQLNMVS